MEEEINIKEILQKLWDGKWLIAIITIIILLFTSIYSFLIADPVYKGTAQISVTSVSSVPENIQPVVTEVTKPNMLAAKMTSSEVLAQVIEEQDLDITVGSLQSKLNIELPTEETSPYISVSMEGTDREEITAIIDQTINQAREKMNVDIESRLGVLAEEYQQKMNEENEKITTVVDEFNTMQAGEGLPALVLLEQSTTEGKYILDVNEEILDELRELNKTDQVEYEKINTEIEDLTDLYNFYRKQYDEVSSVQTMNIAEMSTDVIAEPFVPTQPISPNKILNLAISIVLGLILGVFIVLFRSYMKDE
ncbi:hypothetical protein Pryu01_00808 [Paraliobacillus ryukyuensis]|uniref:Putative tyrosine kinase-like protein n=1 Tax=Paraliobacillus ryukyuensis TaxID=200904 RepID=A0A366EGR3_9BACI|nr:Wzz/FepE/Etk N-terminal domain-containing protein [Paraliobacillus ryukyuensis]RBP00619.1 putative tyrosine kinase-like protein [Paraliobacillus ryukyuensis]